MCIGGHSEEEWITVVPQFSHRHLVTKIKVVKLQKNKQLSESLKKLIKDNLQLLSDVRQYDRPHSLSTKSICEIKS